MKKNVLSLVLLASLMGFSSLSSCTTEASQQSSPLELVDYVSQVKLSMEYEGKNFLTDGAGEATVKQYVDGDTTHFIELDKREVKTRYGGINTPESTAQIQKWGKSASIFTQSKLESAKHIVLTNPSMQAGKPELDSTNTRYMTFVWYTTVEDPTLDDFRLLNLEIVQEGYSTVYSMLSTDPFYDIFVEAANQARLQGIHIYAPETTKDPNYYEGEATTLTIKEFNEKAAEYENRSVFIPSGIVAGFLGVGTVWLEQLYTGETDEEGNETGDVEEVYGLQVFTGYSGKAVPLYTVGNEVSLQGTVTEFNGTYQLTNITYSPFLPSEGDVKLLSQNNPVPDVYQVDTLENILTGKYNSNTFVNCTDVLTCTGGYGGTDNIDKNTGLNFENDAFTLYCRNEKGTEVQIYIPDGSGFRDDNGNLIHDWAFFKDKSFTVRGLTEEYNGRYNLEVPGSSNLTFVSDAAVEE